MCDTNHVSAMNCMCQNHQIRRFDAGDAKLTVYLLIAEILVNLI